jgi:hypothetical protein
MCDEEFLETGEGAVPPWAEVKAWFESQPKPSPEVMAEAVELVREAQVELRRKHGLPCKPSHMVGHLPSTTKEPNEKG